MQYHKGDFAGHCIYILCVCMCVCVLCVCVVCLCVCVVFSITANQSNCL